MNVKWAVAAVVGPLTLAGCAAPSAIIADLETDKVVVHSDWTNEDEEIRAKAREGCAIHNRIPSNPLSRRCLDQYCSTREDLFACIEQ